MEKLKKEEHPMQAAKDIADCIASSVHTFDVAVDEANRIRQAFATILVKAFPGAKRKIDHSGYYGNNKFVWEHPHSVIQSIIKNITANNALEERFYNAMLAAGWKE